MFAFQSRFYQATEYCTGEKFYEVINDTGVIGTIDECRRLLKAGDRRGYDNRKKSLPAFIFQSTFEPNDHDTNWPVKMWRLQKYARLNGLVMLDFDHLSDKGLTPKGLFDTIPLHWFDYKSANIAVMLAHVTPSGDGLRLVCTCDPQRGDLAAHQTFIGTCLGVKCDESVKNADRISFACKKEDILFINEKIFDYENPEYDKMYGDLCRSAIHQPRTRSGIGATDIPSQPTQVAEGKDVGCGVEAESLAGAPALADEVGLKPLEYNGIPAQTIIDEWTKQNGWQEGDSRHPAMIELASDLLTIIERDPNVLEQWLRLAPFVQSIIRERGDEEVKKAAADACGWTATPFKRKEFKQVLTKVKAVKRRTTSKEEAEEADRADLSMYSTYWERLKPLLAPPYDVACSLTDDYNKLGAVFAAGAMFCTLMTRCWYEHFDGMRQRMNPQVYIIGMPAAGKSFADRLNNIIMGPMRAADEVGREAEREYNRKLKERQTSSKAAKGEALKRPDIMVRYCLSKTSNSVLFRRMMNARETIDGEEMHLHLYTFDSELDANTAAQKGGSWIDKHDIELKAFHNEETGVDYNNVDSSNGVYQVFYNSVCTGTPLSLNRKINIRNVNDGLCSRIAFFRMVPDGFHMIQKGNRLRNHEQECQLKQWAFRFDSMKGELGIKPLVDHVYNLCEQTTFEAEASGDRVLDFLRKRAVFYATWLTIPRIYGRQWDSYQKTGEVTVDDSDLQFATLMYDAVIFWQDRFFGQMLQESWDNAENDYKPRLRRGRNDNAFAALPAQFSFQQAMDIMQLSRGGTGMQLNRWVAQGVLERLEQGQYKKKGQLA